MFPHEKFSTRVNYDGVRVEGTYLSKSLKFSHSALLLSDMISFVFRNWHLDATKSTTGASASVVTMHLALEASNL